MAICLVAPEATRIVGAYGEDDAYGPEHRDTLTACANLAYGTGEAGDAARGPVTSSSSCCLSRNG